MRQLFVILSFAILSLFSMPQVMAKEDVQGKFLGAKTATHPDWFKESFLDLEEDIADSTEAGKRLVVYFWQAGCPYCSQLWSDNFAHKDIEKTFRKNFEIVAINMWGDKEVVTIGGKNYTEKSFSDALSIAYTPTLFFFDENKKVVHKVAGYIPPKDFRLVMEYVSQHKEKEGNYASFIASKNKNIADGKLHSEPFFLKPPYNLNNRSLDTANKGKYTAVFFEKPACKNCDLLHEKTLKDKETIKLIEQFRAIQLNRYADTQIITPTANKTTAKEWANQLNITYLPAMVFFDPNGKEVMRIDTQMHSFHIQSVYDYVLSGAYKTEPNFQRYISARSEKIREHGKTVDIWKY